VPRFVVMSPTMRCNLLTYTNGTLLDQPTVDALARLGNVAPGISVTIEDPAVVAWADDYSARFKALTEPLSEAQIADPSDRWHREKPEYKNLFRFKPKPGQEPDA